MSHRQAQHGGSDSTNLQAGRDIVVHNGVTVGEARQIALDVYNANALKLAGVAEGIARDRAERITRDFIYGLQSKDPEALANIGDPDMLATLYVAQEAYARSGESDLERVLVDLLIDRTGKGERDLKAIILNEAIVVVPKLTKTHRAFLSAISFVRNTRHTGPSDLPSVYSYIGDYFIPFVDDLSKNTDADVEYMLFQRVINRTSPGRELVNVLYDDFFGLFTPGFSRENARASYRDFLDDPEVFIACRRDPQKLQVNTISRSGAHEIFKAKGLYSLLPNLPGYVSPKEIESDLAVQFPVLAKIIRSNSPVKHYYASFQLTSVGLSIAQACRHCLSPRRAPPAGPAPQGRLWSPVAE